ncbi:MAG: DNA double-strand break repair nuclease NurA [archaeon]
MEDIVGEILKNIQEESSGSLKLVFNRKGLVPLEIDEKRYHSISPDKSKGKIAFIDGGNSEILASSAFSLHAIRIVALVYEHNKRISIKKKEFKVLVTVDGDKYVSKIFPDFAFPALSFDIDDEELRRGKERVEIGRIGSLIRRLAELELATEVAADVNLVVLDGILEAKFEHERKFLENLYASDANIVGIAKTCNLVTNKGGPITAVFEKTGSWYYYPSIKGSNPDYNADLYFVKLHDRSDYVFRMDVHKGEIGKILALLSTNAKDPVFLGYPYGLIEADKLARISNKEADLIKTQLMVRFGKDWKKVKRSLNSLNAHQILDNIS